MLWIMCQSHEIGPPSITLNYLATTVFMEGMVGLHLPVLPEHEEIYHLKNCKEKIQV